MNAEMDAVSGEVTEGEWSDAAVTVADCPELVCDARREDYYTQFTGGTVVADCAEEDGTKRPDQKLRKRHNSWLRVGDGVCGRVF